MNSKIASLAKAAYEKRREKRGSPGFNAAAQIIDVSGEHAFVPPGPKDMVRSILQTSAFLVL